MRSGDFWRYFDSLRPQLGARAPTFAATFEYLDRFDRPVGIVETGCTRQAGNWSGDGGSTLLFDKYAEFHPGTVVHTVDIDAAATALCRSLVSPRVTVHTGDSVAFLKGLADGGSVELPGVDLLYLDSYDVNFDDVGPSALHHMKELVAVSPLLHPQTLVVVDDSPSSFTGFVEAGGQIRLVAPPRIGGKGKFVAEYAQHVGAEKMFDGYQCGWTRMRGAAGSVVPASPFITAIVTSSPHGTYAVGVEDEFVGRELRQTGAYGVAEVERAANYFGKGDEVLVVGSHVGTIAIALAARCRHVTMIEANPWTFRLLQCNLLLNDVRNATALHFAASDREETLKFVMSRTNSGGSKRMPLVRDPAYFYDNPAVVDVPARALDPQFGERKFALVFMDIEGSETFALRGMQKVLANAGALIVEFIPHHLANVAGVAPEEFAATVAPHFNSLVIPSLGKTVEKTGFAAALRAMFDAGQADAGIVFRK
jgi:FkbM family methyltransferase